MLIKKELSKDRNSWKVAKDIFSSAITEKKWCHGVTETLLQLLFEGVKQGEVPKSSLHRVSLCIKRSKGVLVL